MTDQILVTSKVLVEKLQGMEYLKKLKNEIRRVIPGGELIPAYLREIVSDKSKREALVYAALFGLVVAEKFIEAENAPSSK